MAVVRQSNERMWQNTNNNTNHLNMKLNCLVQIIVALIQAAGAFPSHSVPACDIKVRIIYTCLY